MDTKSDNALLVALLKGATDITVLNTGIENSIAPVAIYPTKEHHSLILNGGKTSNTPLNLTLAARELRIPKDPKDPQYQERHKLAIIKTNALSLTFRGSRNAPVPKVEWDQYYTHLLPMVLEHPKICLQENKNLSETLGKIYKASTDFIGNASLTGEQQLALKAKSLCIPLLAENPWTKSQTEGEDIKLIALEELGLTAAPNARTDADNHRKYNNICVQYERHMTLIREIANHTFLRAIYRTSMKHAQMEYMQVQRDFLNAQIAAQQPRLFTAKEIIDYIEQHCVCSNEKSVQTIQMTINKMVRHNGQTLLQWLQSFIPPTNKYLKAINKAQLNVDEERLLWKKHFSKQINLSEKGCMLMFQTQHLTAQQLPDISKLHDGEFDTATLTVLVTKLATSFEHYTPDKQVMAYLHQHYRSMQINEPLDFTHPKDKRNGDRTEDKKRDSKKRHREDKTSTGKRERPSKLREERKKRKLNKIPTKLQCRRAQCVERGTHANHSHKDCRFKGENTHKKPANMDRKHPNLGKAPRKTTKTFAKTKPDTTVNNKDTIPNKEAGKEAAGDGQRRCFICNSPAHLANACPQKITHKANSKKRLNNNKSFMALWRTQLKTPEEQQCASRLLDAWGDDDRCPQCIQPMYFGHECSKEDRQIMQHLDKVQNVFATTSMLHTIETAHIPYTNSHEDTNTVSINSSFFLHAGGQHTQDLTPIEQDSESCYHSDHESESESSDYTHSENNDTYSENESLSEHEENEIKSVASTPPPDCEDSEDELETQS